MLNILYEWTLEIFTVIFLTVVIYNSYYDVAVGFIFGLIVIKLNLVLKKKIKIKERSTLDNYIIKKLEQRK